MRSPSRVLQPFSFAGLCAGFLASAPLQAQLTVAPQADLQQLAEAISGPGVLISNPSITCHAEGYGEFSYTGSLLGLESGAILSSGRITEAIGPNDAENKTFQQGTSGSSLLNTVTGRSTRDACQFEFDIIPSGDSLRFDFVFGSEEYNEWVGSQYNDVFGFFISGPGIIGDPGIGADRNIALVPGTSDPVAINNVNAGQNSTYYQYNAGGQQLQMDGFTTGLVARSTVQPCQTYHLKLVVADASDRKFDSWVFIERISSPSVSLSTRTLNGTANMVEGCNPGWIRFSRDPVEQDPLTLTYYLQGTAINGSDYSAIGDVSPSAPKTIIIPAGEAFVEQPVNPLADAVNEPTEVLRIILGNPNCPGFAIDSIDFDLTDTLIATVEPLGMQTICNGGSVQFDVHGGLVYAWSPATGLSCSDCPNPVASPSANTNYTVVINEGTCVRSVSRLVRVSNPTITGTLTQPLCDGSTNGAINISASDGIAPYSFNWTGPNGFTSTSEDLVNITPGTYSVETNDAFGCTIVQSYDLDSPQPLAISLVPSIQVFGQNIACHGTSTGTLSLTIAGGTAPHTVLWTGPNGFSSSQQDLTGIAAGEYQVTVTDANGCMATGNYTMSESPALSGAISGVQHVSCNGGSNGQATVTASGGMPPYAFNWDSAPAQTGATASGLTAGNYTVTITDGYGCTAQAAVAISEPATILTVGITGTTDVLCHDGLQGTAQAQAAGGTAPYFYSWNSTPPQFDANANGLPQGSYTVTVTDAQGCTAQAVASIGGPQFEVWAFAESVTPVSCYGLSDGSATLDVSGGSGSYTITWNTTPPQSGLTATGLAPGMYWALVIDNNGCDHEKWVPVEILGPAAPLELQVAQADITCAGVDNGSLDLTISGGLAPYSHTWSDDFGGSTGVEDLSGLDPGVYHLQVSDAGGCTIDTSFTITAPAPISATAQITPAACASTLTGAIDLSVSGGTAPYAYIWSSASGFSASTEDINGIGAGSYIAIVIDANGCQYVNGYNVSQPGGLQADLSVLDQNGYGTSCSGVNDGAIDLTVQGGVVPYDIIWSGPNGFSSSAEDISGLEPGTYSAQVIDGNGCIIAAQDSITAPSPLAADAVSALFNGYSVSCHGGSDGAIDLAFSGGAAPFTVMWTGPNGYSSSNTSINALSAGEYQAAVTDANGCSASAIAMLTEPPVLSATAQAFSWPGGSNITCAGASDGSIDLGIAGGIAPYSINWTDGLGYTATAEDIDGLSAGGYQAVITDANGCITDAFAVITAPDPILLTAQAALINNSNVSCYGAVDGSVDATVIGGSAPYSFAWSNGAATEDLNGIGAGTYTLTITDAHGCASSVSITLDEPAPISVDLLAVTAPGGAHVSCHGASDGTITSTVTGGESPLSYAWSGPDGFTHSDASPSGLAAGQYSLIVTDGQGCSTTAELTLMEPPPVIASISATLYNGFAIACAGQTSGSAEASADGGTGGYSFAWSGPGGFSSPDASISGLPAGSYTVIVTDANGCTGSASVDMLEPQLLDAAISITDLGGFQVSCNGNDGSAAAVLSGGTAPYATVWTGPDGFNSTLASITGLASGEYQLTATDANGCTLSETITLTAPLPVEATFSSTANNCPDEANGSIDAVISGGASTYTYTWSGPNGFTSTDEDLSGLSSGTYSLVVTDALGCGGSFSAELIGPAPINSGTYVSFYGLYNLQCMGDSSGVLDLTPVGGTTPFSVAISGPGGFQSTALTNGSLVAGDYLITITDANGCAMDTLVTLTEPGTQVDAQLSVSVYPSGTNVSCFGASDGWIDATITGGSGPYTFDWRGPDSLAFSSEDIFNLPAGTYAYELVVTDANQCAFSTTVTLTQPDSAMHANAAISDYNGFGVSCSGSSDGAIDLSYGGGNGGYSVSWAGPNGFTSDDEDLSGLTNGTYTVTITDMNGCELVQAYALDAPPVIAATLSPSDFNGNGVSCAGANDGGISAGITGGTGPYTLSWSGPGGFSNSDAQINGLMAGTYCLAITDANGCAAQSCITLVEPMPLEAMAQANMASCGNSNGSILLNASGGTAPYSFAWSNGSNAQNLIALNSGDYDALVTDANGCTAQASAAITNTPAVEALAQVSDVLCNGTATGGIAVDVISGSAPYSFAWSDGSLNEDLAGAIGGSYALVVTDVNGCTWNGQWTIAESAAIEIEASLSSYTGGYEVSVFGGTDGSVSLSVSGGAQPYSYWWSNGSTASFLSDLPAGTYTVTITDANGCTATRTITLEEPNDLVMPTGFTPNGDGHNDLFVVQGLDAYPGNLLTVLNRWGNVVLEQLNYKNDWAGDNAKGEPLPNGTYFAILSINSGQRNLQGYVDLRR